MGCNDCQSPSLQGTQYCQECMPDESSVIIPDTIVPDPFLMDRNHIYLLPNGESYILNYDRTQAIKLGGSGGGSSVDISSLEDKIKKAQYDDTELRNKVDELSNKEDKDTIYNDTEIKAKLKELEEKLNKKEDIPVKYHYVETNINKNGYVLTSGKGNNKITTIKLSDDFNFDYDTLIVDMLFSDIKAYKYTSINDIDESDDQEFSTPEEEAMAKKPNEPLYTFKTGNQIVLDSNSNNHYFNTVFLVGNGDIIYFNFKVNIYSDKLVLSEQSAFLEKAKTTSYRTYIPIDPFASTIYYTKIKNKDFDFTISDGLMIKVIRKRLEREG